MAQVTDVRYRHETEVKFWTRQASETDSLKPFIICSECDRVVSEDREIIGKAKRRPVTDVYVPPCGFQRFNTREHKFHTG